jgi:Na+-translocating ferredoxin:NAD+ oxidoreductase subunit B
VSGVISPITNDRSPNSSSTPLNATPATFTDRIDAILPQTQCTRCGYPACRPYAEAIAAGTAGINQCPPGGAVGVARLAALTQRAIVPLDPLYGVEAPRRVALIDEPRCIGCTLCIQACPVDAIVGAPKVMHTVLAALCSGCDLCLPACPVDCIEMVEPTGDARDWNDPEREAARARFVARDRRLGAEKAARIQRLAAGRNAVATAPTTSASRREAIVAARERVRARRAAADRSSAEDSQ